MALSPVTVATEYDQILLGHSFHIQADGYDGWMDQLSQVRGWVQDLEAKRGPLSRIVVYKCQDGRSLERKILRGKRPDEAEFVKLA